MVTTIVENTIKIITNKIEYFDIHAIVLKDDHLVCMKTEFGKLTELFKYAYSIKNEKTQANDYKSMCYNLF